MIELQANAAERAVENYLDRPLEELVREDGTLPEDVVPEISNAPPKPLEVFLVKVLE